MEATKFMCYICFEALENQVTKGNSTVFSGQIPSDDKRKCPMFVTWKKDRLRGCIGIFRELPLWEGLQNYAIIAGTRDHRFPPIEASELPELNCGISLLHSFEDAKDALDWEIGKHGIRLFIDDYSATYLPQVAAEQGWTKEETLSSLARKAGFPYKFDSECIKRSRVVRYQSAKMSATWEEYQEAKKLV